MWDEEAIYQDADIETREAELDATQATGECVYCEQTVWLAEDGAWETADGACGCTASLERGGDGEHEALTPAELAATEREVRLEEERAADLIERENVRGISAPDF